jgi:hypothetical protein
MKTTPKNQFWLGLLPNYFKKVGLVISIAAIIAQISLVYISQNEPHSLKEIIKTICSSLFTVGLFFFAFSKEKVEDEMNYFIRMRSMALTLLFVIITGILSPILYLVFNEAPTIRETQGFVTTVILQYMATFYIQKMMK